MSGSSALSLVDDLITKLSLSSDTPSAEPSKPNPKTSPANPNGWVEPSIANETATLRFQETINEKYGLTFELADIHFSKKSQFQHIQIIETVEFGKTLILDLKTQSAQRDEKLYHESLVHPPMTAHPNPKKVFIGGGGELATAREVLKYPQVERVVCCDLDGDVVDACLKHMPFMSDGSHNDKRLEIQIGDARKALLETTEVFDIIIMDIADPIEAGPGIACYYEEFYKQLRAKMSPNGVFITQAGPGGVATYDECCTVIYNTVKSAFGVASLHKMDIPSFGCPWAFVMGYNSGHLPSVFSDDNCAQLIDKQIVSRFNGDFEKVDRIFTHYDGETHSHMFNLGIALRKELAKETRVMTHDTPVYFY